jgi:hypothetical protein
VLGVRPLEIRPAGVLSVVTTRPERRVSSVCI